MTEQQQHLANLLSQREQIIANLQNTQNQLSSSRDALLKTEGAIEYLQAIGVTLPEPEIEDTSEVVEQTEEGANS